MPRVASQRAKLFEHTTLIHTFRYVHGHEQVPQKAPTYSVDEPRNSPCIYVTILYKRPRSFVLYKKNMGSSYFCDSFESNLSKLMAQKKVFLRVLQCLQLQQLASMTITIGLNYTSIASLSFITALAYLIVYLVIRREALAELVFINKFATYPWIFAFSLLGGSTLLLAYFNPHWGSPAVLLTIYVSLLVVSAVFYKGMR